MNRLDILDHMGLSLHYAYYGKYAHLDTCHYAAPLGTGSQREYDRAMSLPLCPECASRLALYVPCAQCGAGEAQSCEENGRTTPYHDQRVALARTL